LSRIDVVRADIRNRAAVAKAVQGCRQVYHLAANPQLWTQQRGVFYQVNYLGAVNILEAAVAAGAHRIVHTSTESILTRSEVSAPIVANQRISARDIVGPYCRSKYLAERYALRVGRAGAPVVVVNPTLPVGPGDWGRSPPTQMLLDYCRGKRREFVDAALNLVDVRDVADGMIQACERARPGRRYLLAGENLSLRAIFGILARLTGLPEPNRRVPYALALGAAYISEWLADLITHHCPAATVTGVKLTRRRMHFDPGPSLVELGIYLRPITQSLADELAWFRSVGWLDGSLSGGESKSEIQVTPR
jgi:dihydroflavonol-4-reductase